MFAEVGLRKKSTTILLFLFVIAFFYTKPITVFGSNFTTNTTNDTIDINPGNGICADSNGLCSLRAGIMETNELAGEDTLYISAGNYQVSAKYFDTLSNQESPNISFEINDALNLIGNGSSTTTINATSNSLIHLFAVGVQDIISKFNVSGFTVNGSSASCDNAFLISQVLISSLSDIQESNCSTGFQSGEVQVTINNSKFADNSLSGIISNSSNITINNTVIEGNNAIGLQINNTDNTKIARVNNSKIINNSGQNGGGVYFQESCYAFSLAQSLYIKNTEISGNNATNGAGIYNYCGHLDLENTTLSGNNATNYGGGLHTSYPLENFTNNDGDNTTGTTQAIPTTFTEVRNSTFSGNSAQNAGAIYVDTHRPAEATVPYTFDMLNTTIANNSSGIGFYNSASYSQEPSPINIHLRNNLLVNNGTENCTFENNGIIIDNNLPQSLDLVLGSSYTGNNNLSNDSSCNQLSSFTTGTNLGDFLGPLQNNGNTTKTHALLAGSSAINTGSNSDCPIIDQRLVTRPQGISCDIGSFEYQPQTKTINGVLYIDINKNGKKDLDDIVLNNVVVEIINAQGELITQIVTDENGNFSIDLEIGEYSYKIDLKSLRLSEELNAALIGYGSLNQRFIVSSTGEIQIQIPLVISQTNSEKIHFKLIRTGGTN